MLLSVAAGVHLSAPSPADAILVPGSLAPTPVASPSLIWVAGSLITAVFSAVVVGESAQSAARLDATAAAVPSQHQGRDPRLWVPLTLISIACLILTFYFVIDVFGCRSARSSVANASKPLTILSTAALLSTCVLFCLFHLRYCCLDWFVFGSPLWYWGHKSNVIEDNSQSCLPTHEPLAPSVKPHTSGPHMGTLRPTAGLSPLSLCWPLPSRAVRR